MIDSLHHRIGLEGRYYIFPLIGTCIASFFLFLSVFGAPFIPLIYLVQLDFRFAPPKVMSALLGLGHIEIVFAPTIGTTSHMSPFRVSYSGGSVFDGRYISLPPTPSSYMPPRRHSHILKEDTSA
jgi:hypothetical protein